MDEHQHCTQPAVSQEQKPSDLCEQQKEISFQMLDAVPHTALEPALPLQ